MGIDFVSLFARFVEILQHKFQKPLAGLVLFIIAVTVIAVAVWPVYAAVELVDYNVRSSQSDIVLLWNTAHEYDLSGFEIQCKPANEPDTAYHAIGFREAQGSPQKGAQYFFLINQNLTPGQSYCFRLSEQTTNNQPGEVFDRCGYGLGITPTPTLTATVALTGTGAISSSTWISLTPVILVTRALTETTVTTTSVVSTSVTLTEPTMTPTPIVVSPLQSPLTPELTPSSVITPGAPPVNSGPASQPPLAPAPTVTATATLTSSQTTTQTNGAMINSGIVDSGANSTTGPVAQAVNTPDPAYLVVTATPLPDGLALPPLLTPLPTITSAPNVNLASIAQPNTQNVIILLLCFTFFGASGLGVLGLLTSILYMRSRRATTDRYSSRQQF